MRGILWSLSVVLICAGPGRANEKEALKVVDRAIQALGGDKLAKVDAVSWKGKSKITVENVMAEMQDELQASGSERVRWKVDLSFMGMMKTGLLILDGPKGWLNADNKTMDMPKEVHAMMREHLRLTRHVQQLTALRDEKRFTLSHLGELKIDDRPAVGIKIVEKDRPEIDLFFDKQTGLPLRAEVRLTEPDSQEKLYAFFFTDYKDFDGIKHFTKLTIKRDDKPIIEMELSDIKREAKLDDSLFAKP